MTNSTNNLNNAWIIATTPAPTLAPEQIADIKRRQTEDFDFMVLCASKGNMGMYRLLRDESFDQYKGMKL